MPTTRKKVIKTVYKDEDDSEAEDGVGDFSDSGSEAEIPEHSSSEDEIEAQPSEDEFEDKSKKKFQQLKRVKKQPKFAKQFISKINRQFSVGDEDPIAPVQFSVKDLTEEDKLLPAVLNLSESDSSEDESDKPTKKKPIPASTSLAQRNLSDSETEVNTEFKDVWSQNMQDNSEDIAKKTFMELEQHKNKIEETKASILNYTGSKIYHERESDVKDLLALGEEILPETVQAKKGRKNKKVKDDSDSEMEDWEEVKEARSIPQQGIQLIVDFPDAACRKTKKLDLEMMMKRKINRVKKEYQVYMHKVHVLCWLAHGNYVSRVLNDQEVLAAALSLVPSKECYPGERVDMKYLEQITTWYKDKLTLKQDKNEDKFRPKAPPLKDILLAQIKSRVVTTKKYMVYIFVSMLRAIGLQCRVMFNFVTLPIKPPTSELCSLSTKPKDEKKHAPKTTDPSKSKDKCITENKGASKDKEVEKKSENKEKKKCNSKKSKSKSKISQMDGNFDSFSSSDCEIDDIMQLDGNDDPPTRTRSIRSSRTNKTATKSNEDEEEAVSPPKKARKSPIPKVAKSTTKTETTTLLAENTPQRIKRVCRKSPENLKSKTVTNSETKYVGENTSQRRKRACRKSPENLEGKTIIQDTKTETKKSQGKQNTTENNEKMDVDITVSKNISSSRKTGTSNCKSNEVKSKPAKTNSSEPQILNPPKITITDVNNKTNTASKYFADMKTSTTKSLSLRKRTQTANSSSHIVDKTDKKITQPKSRTKSAPGNSVETSKYFKEEKPSAVKATKSLKLTRQEAAEEDKHRVSHRDILAKNKIKTKNDITGDLVDIIKNRVREAKEDSKKGKVKAKVKQESDADSDYLPVESPKRHSDSDEDFKPTKISPKPSTSRVTAVKRLDRRVLSSDDETTSANKCNVWCEVFVEELEQWIAVDVVRAKVHCTNEIYSRTTHPVCYIVGWDNNNYLKDLTRRYVPHWNTVTRKQRAEPAWWDKAVKPWLGPRSPRDREEDEQLNRMQLEAPLPTSIGEYKNHPLYALKRHLLKFEAIYPPDAAVLGFVRKEPVYARECVYVCRSRDTWLKEAKVVRLGEQPYKVVKARPKWDRLSNKLITDKPLEVFGPWQVQDYEPPVAENGVVPRNAYGNVELFKECMLPRGTVHIKLPGLNRVAKKLNIDCAPAMTGFDFNGGWSHPVYDGFVVCQEFEQVITEAWVKDQEDQERRELEKIEARVYGNWRRLIKGLLIRERLKDKYGFEDPATVVADKKKKGPRLVVKKNKM